MPRYIALLRGINVGGHRRVPMKQLEGLLESLGFEGVRTYLQSGNAVFDTSSRSAAKVRASVEAAIAEHFGFAVEVLVIPAAELAPVVAGCPFAAAAAAEPARVFAVFLFERPSSEAIRQFAPPKGELGVCRVGERVAYVHCPGGYGNSKLTNDYFERKLGVGATGRNWNTVLALAAMAGER